MSSIVVVNNNRSINDEKEEEKLTKSIYSSIKKILLKIEFYSYDCKFDFHKIIIIILQALIDKK